MPRVVAIVQARMGSTRLPGKVLQHIAGKPLLWHVYHRLALSRTIDQSILAISTNPLDDPLEVWANEQNIMLFRGSEHNLLKRYYCAAKVTEAEIVVRITGDAPLVDPYMIDTLVEKLLENKDADFATANPSQPCIDEGFNPLTRRSLNRLHDEVGENPIAVEHVSAYFKTFPNFAKTVYIDVPPEHQFSGARLSVDTPADLEFMEAIHQELHAPAGEIEISALVHLLQRKPQLLKLNQHVHQKNADEIGKSILIRCDGDENIGLGHVYRMLALAEVLRTQYSSAIRFVVIGGESAISLIREHHFNLDIIHPGNDEQFGINRLIIKHKPAALIFDIRTEIPGIAVRNWRKSGISCVVYDDSSERRLEASLVILPPVPQLRDLSWDGFKGTLLVGFKYTLLRSQFKELGPKKKLSIPRIFISMGASDPFGLIFLVIDALSLLEFEFHADFLIGRAFQKNEMLSKILHKVTFKMQLHTNIKNVANLMAQTDFGVVAFGMIAYELGSLRIPAVHIGLTPDHVKSASIFEEKGLALNLGIYTQLTGVDVAKGIERGIKELVITSQIDDDTLDNLGSERVAQAIIDKIGTSKPQIK